MSNTVPHILSPNGNEYPVKTPDEASRFLYILSNGYLDADVAELTKDLEEGKLTRFEFGGWAIEMKEVAEKTPQVSYRCTKGDKDEVVHSLEGIAHVCDCTIGTVATRLKKNPEGFTVKGWTVAKVAA